MENGTAFAPSGLSAPIDRDLAAAILRTRFVAFDFDGVFTDNGVYVAQDGTEMVRCCRSDGIGLDKLRRLGIGFAIISTEANPVVSVRAHKLRMRCIQGCDDKLAALAGLLAEEELSLGQAAFMGNDVNDLPCLERVGLPIVVSDAHPDVVRVARHRTKALGGRGAVREICDLFERAYSRI